MIITNTLTVASFALGSIATILLANLLLSIFNAGKRDFDEAQQLQGSVTDVWNGRVNSSYELTNDPRLIEGMEGFEYENGVKQFYHQKKTSDDYLKSLFGA